MQAIAAVGPAGNDAPQELDVLAPFLDGDGIILDFRRIVGHGDELMVVRRKQRQGVDVLQAVFDDGPGDGHAVEGTRTAADFIEDEQAAAGGVFQDVRHFLHFHHERTLAGEDVVAGTDTGKDTVHRADGPFLGGNEGACLGHEDQHGDLAHIRRLAGHVGAGDDQNFMVFMVQGDVVRHEQFVFQILFNNRMAAVLNGNRRLGIEAGTDVAVVIGRAGQAVQTVDAGNGPGRFLHGRDMALDLAADIAEELVFQRQHPFLAGQDLDFKFLQFRRDVAFGIDQRLLAHVVIGDGLGIGMGNLEVIAKDLGIADFHLDARLFPFLLFQFLQKGMTVGRNGADFIEFRRKAVADDAAVADDQARFVLDAPAEQVIDVVMGLQAVIEAVQEVGTGTGQDLFQLRDDGQRFPQGYQVFRAHGPRFDAGQDAFKIVDPVQHVCRVLAHDFVEDEVFDGILAARNVGNADERRFQPLAQEPAAHGRLGLVQDIEEGPPAAAVADVLRDFQMAQAGRIDDQTPFIVDMFQRIDVGNIGLHDVADISQEHADTLAGRRGSSKVFGREIGPGLFPVVDTVIGRKFRDRTLSQVAAQVFADGVHILPHVGVNEFTRFVDGQDVEQTVFHDRGRAVGPQTFARRDVHEGDGKDGIAFGQAADVIVLLRRHGILQGNRPRRDDLDDLALDDSLGQFRVFHLFADSDFIAFVDQPFDIGVGRMEWYAAHGDLLFIAASPAGQGQVEFARRRQGIVKKHFIEIAEAEKEDFILALLFDFHVLLHHRR